MCVFIDIELLADEGDQFRCIGAIGEGETSCFGGASGIR
jgi:hypothetical protein